VQGKSAGVVAAVAALHVIFSHSESQKPNECLCRARPGVAQQREMQMMQKCEAQGHQRRLIQ